MCKRIKKKKKFCVYFQTDSKDNKKKDNNSISSLDNLDSPLSDSKKSLGLSSPSALSTCSNSSTDREKKKRRVGGILVLFLWRNDKILAGRTERNFSAYHRLALSVYIARTVQAPRL